MKVVSATFNALININKETLQVRDGELKTCTTSEKLKRLVSPHYDKKEIQAVADHIFAGIQDPQKKETSLALAKTFIKRFEHTFQGGKISKIFDRMVMDHRPEHTFEHHANRSGFGKWQRYNQDPAIYLQHPEFCNFMESSGLLSQIKVTRDAFQEIDGEPAIKVNSEWMKWTDFKDQFEASFSKRYNETFIVHKKSCEVYTYLDNGKGLQIHHPFLSDRTPISNLNDDDHAKVIAIAQTFVREGEEKLTQDERDALNQSRIFVLQLVTSHVKGPDTGFHDLIAVSNLQHPYVRLIIGKDNPNFSTKKGEIYEVGYVLKNKIKLPLAATEGRFRSPDINEYRSFDEKVVTSIAITAEEARSFGSFISNYHRQEVNLGNPIGFHFLKQNCTTFVRTALASANIKVPTEVTLKQLWFKVVPAWIMKANTVFKNLLDMSTSLAKHCIKILPSWIKDPLRKMAEKIAQLRQKALEALSALVFLPLKLALGDASGSGGRAFVQEGEEPRNIEPNLMQLENGFKLSSYTINLPGILQRWQRDQPSTVIYKNPIQLCIVP